MALFKLPHLKFWQQQVPNTSRTELTQSSHLQTPPQPIVPKRKFLTELEREMEAEAQRLRVHPTYPIAPPSRRPNGMNKVLWLAILLGVPVGVLWAVNLPYAPIRYPVARTAPILLLPSYMSIDSNYRQAIASVEQAKQLIDNPTSPADLDSGEQKVSEAQARLDALPIDLLNTFPQSRYWWYDWHFSMTGFRSARAEVGRLQATVFQEQNAQTALLEAEQTLNVTKHNYQQATTPLDKQTAIGEWRLALDQFTQIPGQTLAGQTAQQKLQAYQRDFQETVGLAANNQRASTVIEAARQFGWQAAQSSQNPPHSVEEWQRVENLWQDAIRRLDQVPSNDLVGYAEAQKLLATYRANIEQIKVRKQAEAEAVEILQQVEQEIEYLQASIPNDGNIININQTISRLQSITNQLNRVEEGTTAYLKAQELLLFAQNKLTQLQP